MTPPGGPHAGGTSPPSDPHRDTLAVYETRAGEWAEHRSPRTARAEDFSRWVQRSGPGTGATVDLGCGPGRHLPALPAPVVALDGAAAMLDMVPRHASDALRVQADLRALPLRRGSLRAAWASKSYVHLARSLVPLALWDLHRALRVGGLVEISLFAGDAEHAGFDDDDFPGRAFSLWPEQLLADVLEGAGFEVDLLEAERPRRAGHTPLIRVRARRLRTLADTVGPGMDLLLVGLNPSLHAADAGVGFAGPGNRGWPALVEAGLAGAARDPLALLQKDGVGMTDLAKRASPRSSDLRPEEFRHGLARLDRLCRWLEPGAVCVVGLTGWRHATGRKATPGEQDITIGGRPVWVMPNPSGLNAATGLDELVAHLRSAARLAGRG